MRNQQVRLAVGQDLQCEEFRQLQTDKQYLYYLMLLEYQSHPKCRLRRCIGIATWNQNRMAKHICRGCDAEF